MDADLAASCIFRSLLQDTPIVHAGALSEHMDDQLVVLEGWLRTIPGASDSAFLVQARALSTHTGLCLIPFHPPDLLHLEIVACSHLLIECLVVQGTARDIIDASTHTALLPCTTRGTIDQLTGLSINLVICPVR